MGANVVVSPPWLDEVRRLARRIRRRVLAHVLANDGGYLSQACSSAELLATLYGRVLRLGPSQAPRIPVPFPGVPQARLPGDGPTVRFDPVVSLGARYHGPRAPELDRLVFSPVHYSLVLYALLVELDRLDPEALEQFNADGSTVEMIGAEHSPGIEVTAGSLAQAISVAGGMALGRRLRGDTGRVVVFMTDGEFEEGQTWEAFAAAAFHGLSNLLVYVDANGQQCDGALADVMRIEPLAERLASFGAAVHEVDGHDPEALATPADTPSAGPTVVIARTDPCRGLDVLRPRAPKLHYVRFADDAERAAFSEALATLEEEA